MREIRPSGSEGGGVLPRALPTPIGKLNHYPAELNVVRIKSDRDSLLLPLVVHQQKIPKEAIFVSGGIFLGVISLQEFGGVNQLTEVKTIRDFHQLVDAEVVRRIGAQLRPPVVEQENFLPVIRFVDRNPLSGDEKEALQIVAEPLRAQP